MPGWECPLDARRLSGVSGVDPIDVPALIQGEVQADQGIASGLDRIAERKQIDREVLRPDWSGHRLGRSDAFAPGTMPNRHRGSTGSVPEQSALARVRHRRKIRQPQISPLRCASVEMTKPLQTYLVISTGAQRSGEICGSHLGSDRPPHCSRRQPRLRNLGTLRPPFQARAKRACSL